MNNNEFRPKYSATELLQAKFIELKGNPLGKYFFLYFLHLLGYFTYNEENSESVFSNTSQTFKVPLPVIDSDEKFRQLELINRNLEKFFDFLKRSQNPGEKVDLRFIDNF